VYIVLPPVRIRTPVDPAATQLSLMNRAHDLVRLRPDATTVVPEAGVFGCDDRDRRSTICRSPTTASLALQMATNTMVGPRRGAENPRGLHDGALLEWIVARLHRVVRRVAVHGGVIGDRYGGEERDVIRG